MEDLPSAEELQVDRAMHILHVHMYVTSAQAVNVQVLQQLPNVQYMFKSLLCLISSDCECRCYKVMHMHHWLRSSQSPILVQCPVCVWRFIIFKLGCTSQSFKVNDYMCFCSVFCYTFTYQKHTCSHMCFQFSAIDAKFTNFETSTHSAPHTCSSMHLLSVQSAAYIPGGQARGYAGSYPVQQTTSASPDEADEELRKQKRTGLCRVCVVQNSTACAW